MIWQRQNETSFRLKNILTQHTSEVWSFVILPNNMLASSSADNTIRIWDQSTFKCIHVLKDHKDAVFKLAVLESGYFVSTSMDKTSIIWDSLSFKKIANVKTNATRGFFSVSSYLDTLFITGDQEGTIQIWSPAK